MSKQTQRSRSILRVSIAIMCSRVLGLVRETALPAFFGTAALEAFYMAYRIPNLLRDLFAEGALSTAFVTTFSQKIKADDEGSAFALAAKMLTLISVFMSILIILGIVFTPIIVNLIAPGFKTENLKITIYLTKIMFPFIGILSVSALVMGILNSKNFFFAPALASSFFNLGSIIAGLGLGYWLDPSFQTKALTGLAIGVLIGGLCQLGFQLPFLHKAGFRFRLDFNWRDSGVSKVLQIMWPALIAGSVIQLSVFIDSAFATFCATSSVTWLQSSFRLIQLPLGLFGVAVGMITLPAVSRSAAGKNLSEFSEILAHGLRFVVLLVLPAGLGLYFLSDQIISIIYQRGRFNFLDTINVSYALQMYTIGLIFYACIRVVQPAFYALDLRMVPMIVSIITLVLKTICNYIFIFVIFEDEPDRHKYLALSTSIAAVTSCCILFMLMRRKLGHIHGRDFLLHLAKLILPAGLVLLVCFYANNYFIPIADFSKFGFWQKTWSLGIIILLSAVAYGVSAFMLKVDGTRDFVKLTKK